MEKIVPDPFLENKNWAYLWINSLDFHTICFYCIPNWGLSKYIETKLQTTCVYLILSIFKKETEVWNWSPCLTFCIAFEQKFFSCDILLIDQVSFCGCFYFVGYRAICVFQLFIVYSNCFKLIFLIKLFLLHDQKVMIKLKYLANG